MKGKVKLLHISPHTYTQSTWISSQKAILYTQGNYCYLHFILFYLISPLLCCLNCDLGKLYLCPRTLLLYDIIFCVLGRSGVLGKASSVLFPMIYCRSFLFERRDVEWQFPLTTPGDEYLPSLAGICLVCAPIWPPNLDHPLFPKPRF